MKTKNVNSEIIKIGEVGVDSAKLIICDPHYIEREYKRHVEQSDDLQSRHEIYRHTGDNTLWQYVDRGFGRELVSDVVPDIKPFPGSYEDMIPEYGMTPNMLRDLGLFVDSEFDPMHKTPKGEFSLDSIFKGVYDSPNQTTQITYSDGRPGVGVAFTTGYGDGMYEVFAEIVHTKLMGRRIKKVWVEFLGDDEDGDDSAEN